MEKIVAITDAGVCDRLALALFGLAIAMELDRPFEFIWPASAKCGCSFNRLFRTDKFVVHGLNPYPKSRTLRLVGPSTFKKTIQQIAKCDLPFVLLEDYFGHNFQDVANVFSPIPEIEDAVENFKRQHFGTPMVGVHLRRGDKMHFTPAPVEKFIDAAEMLRRELGGRVFLATDFPAAASAFRLKFGADLVTYPTRTLSRENEHGVIDSVVTLYLLRACDIVVGSVFSGFSLMAGWHTQFINIPSQISMNLDWDGNKIERVGRPVHLSSLKK